MEEITELEYHRLTYAVHRLANVLDELSKSPPESKLLVKRVIVEKSGSPVQLPEGKVVGKYIRFGTRDNTGNVYISSAPQTAMSGEILRFGITTGQYINYRVSDDFELSQLWVDADNDADALEVWCEVEVPLQASHNPN